MPKKKNDIWVTALLQADGGRKYHATYRDNVHNDGTNNLTHPHGRPETPEYVSFPRLVREIADIETGFYTPGVDLRFDRSKGHRTPFGEEEALKVVVDKLVLMAGRCSELNERLSRIGKMADRARALE